MYGSPRRLPRAPRPPGYDEGPGPGDDVDLAHPRGEGALGVIHLIDLRHRGDDVDGYVDGAGAARDLRGCQRATRVDAVGQHDDRAARGRRRGYTTRRFGNRIV